MFFLACECDKLGSENNDCNVATGQCQCKTPMIGGKECTHCIDNYFGFPMCESKLNSITTLQIFL